MRQNDECFLLDPGQRVVRDLLGRQIAVAGLRTFRDRPEHVGIDALRTQDRNLDAIGLVRDRKVLRKSDRRMLGCRIGRASYLRQQAGGGNRVEEIPLPARLHAWNQMPRGIDMRHDVDRPASRPRLVGMPPAFSDLGSKPPPMPALEQNSAIGPNCRSVSSMTWRMSFSWPTSHLNAAPSIEAATASAPAKSRSATTTLAAPAR